MRYTPRDVLNALFRYRNRLIAFCVVVLVAAFISYSESARLYDSKATILVSLGTESLGKAQYLDGKNLQLVQREQQLHNEQEILRSHEVLLTTAKWIMAGSAGGADKEMPDWRVAEAKRFLTGEEPQPTFLLRSAAQLSSLLAAYGSHAPGASERLESAAQTLSSDLTVSAVYDSDALDAAFRFRDARVAQTILSLLIAAYFQHHIAVFQSGGEENLLKTQLDHSVDQYRQSLSDYSSFMGKHGMYNDDAQVNLLIEQRDKVKQALTDVLADRDAAATRLASLQGIEQSLEQFETYSTTEVRNKEHETLLSKLNDAAVEETALLARHPKGSRAYNEEESHIAELRDLLKQEPERVVQETEQRKTKAYELVESEIIARKEEQRGDEAKATLLQSELTKISSDLDTYAGDLKGFDALKLNLNIAKQESEQMAQAYVDSRLKLLTSENSITDISMIDQPTWDPEPASPKKKVTIAATFMLLFAGFFAMLAASLGLDTTISDPATAERALGVPVTATLPAMRTKGKRGQSTEQFLLENTREFARIYHAVRGGGPENKIILLTESSPHAGASLVGLGLATFLNRAGHDKVAFVDYTTHATARKKALTAGSEEQPARTAVVRYVPHEEKRVSDALEDRTKALLKLRNDYPYVIVAAEPIGESPDLAALSEVVAATFFIIEASRSRRAAIAYYLEELRRYGFSKVGLILNRRIFYIPRWLMRFV